MLVEGLPDDLGALQASSLRVLDEHIVEGLRETKRYPLHPSRLAPFHV
jgi:hypothetical protein